MKKALVTGATGFIGQRLIKRLLKDGVAVVALTRNKHCDMPSGVHVVRGDIREQNSMDNIGQGCDRLYHLAAMISFDQRNKKELLHVNGTGTANILKLARYCEIERSVVVSSASTLGLTYNKLHVLDENSKPDQQLVESNPYLASKLEAERIAISAANEQIVTIVNPTTVYGSGDWSLNSGTLIKKIAQSSVLPVPPGGSNAVDVDDVVEGIILAGEHGRTGKRYVLGNENLLFSEIFTIITRVVGHSPLMVPVPNWLGGPAVRSTWFLSRFIGNRFLTPSIVNSLFAFKYYSSECAERELKWKATRTFEQSVQRAWVFYKQNRLI